MAGLCEDGNEPPSSLKVSKLFSIDEIGDSEMVFDEMRPRIRHRLPGTHLTVEENLGKNPTRLTRCEIIYKRSVDFCWIKVGDRLLPCHSGCRQARLAGCCVLCRLLPPSRHPRRPRRRGRPAPPSTPSPLFYVPLDTPAHLPPRPRPAPAVVAAPSLAAEAIPAVHAGHDTPRSSCRQDRPLRRPDPVNGYAIPAVGCPSTPGTFPTPPPPRPPSAPPSWPLQLTTPPLRHPRCSRIHDRPRRRGRSSSLRRRLRHPRCYAGVPLDTPEVAAAKTAHFAARAEALALQDGKKRSVAAYAAPAAVATYAAPVAVAAPSFGYSTVSAHTDPVVVAAPAPSVAVAHAAPAAPAVVAAHAAPAVAVAHAAPYAVAAPAVSGSSQYQAQNTLGQYSYGYADSNSQKQEVRTADGITHGGYSYVDCHGLVQSVKYHADTLGFRVAATNLPVGPAAP
ncbi:hypothetical protein ANN_02392 [Periplaneta americana]|uniref:Cuticle protein 6 n=1 Tax=Periplaneta americana TaxID=6978 RepID=A0ABQ8TW48_PERAM|nr:hypothetical protein ANN_02392 [Periplaneta americana]